jgi:hypothetical protein
MNPERALSIDVFPLPVPPATSTLHLATTNARSASAASVDEPRDRQRLLEEATDRHVRAVRRDGREDRLDTRAVGHAALEDGALGAHGLADVLREVAHGGGERLAVVEAGVDPREHALALDVDLVRTVDHDLAHRRVVEVRADRREERQQRLFEDLRGDHGTALMRLARAISACSPSGALAR